MTDITEPKKVSKGVKIFAIICFTLTALIMITIIYAINNSLKQTSTTQPTIEVSQTDQLINTLITSTNVKQAYIINSKDISHATRTRYDTSIFSTEAKSNDELLATAASAAMQIQKQKRVQFSSVVIFNNKDKETPYLTVNFSPDRKGIEGKKDSGSRFQMTWYNKLPQ